MSSADDKPVEKPPTEDKPTEEKPTEEKPTTSAPVEEKPAETAAADEKPADTAAPAEDTSVAAAQVDGAGPPGNGSELAKPDKELKVEVKLADMQADPNNPLFSATSFEQLNLSEELLKGIRMMNFKKPSKIQEKALPLLFLNPPSNMIAQSQSGTGKTAAFSLNILTRIDINVRAPQALVLAPSRELARQILGVIQHMGQFITGLETQAAIPDPANRTKKFTAHVVVGTPGTVMDAVRKRSLDPRQMRILVLDEADNMLDQQGLGEQCTRVKKLIPGTVQTVLFSATFPAQVIDYAQNFAPKANVLTLAHEELTIEGIKQFMVDINDDADKYGTLLKMYGLMTQASSIIFVRTRATALELERRMTDEGHRVAQLSGGLEGSDRDRVIDEFRSGRAKVLIATNVLARGIDVQSVTMVINYDVPTMADNRTADPETYLHRIGRTGRFGRVGVALTFIQNRAQWQQLEAIRSYFGTDITPIDTKDWDNVEDLIQGIIKSSRAGKTTEEMNA
ncbi:unnamed protein product [Periconia digitata]|uniref:RNA helicase n=1 Tax=Periconia digitata TaxID=1303443 RepID=A0A9W4UEF6_9PLEO|nr:unnamed protein product [Periconia digitata]